MTAGGGPSIQEAQQEAYNGPKARITVARVTDKTAQGSWSGQPGDGMTDMLATALFQTNRYIVLERQTVEDVVAEQDWGTSGRVRQGTAAPIGKLEGAELLVTAAVTEFGPEAGGSSGNLGNLLPIGSILGAVGANIRQAHLTLDLRLINVRTSRLVAATRVEGKATDVAASGSLARGALAGGGSHDAKTPIEKAIRTAIQEAVAFVVSRTPAQYYRYTTDS